MLMGTEVRQTGGHVRAWTPTRTRPRRYLNNAGRDEDYPGANPSRPLKEEINSHFRKKCDMTREITVTEDDDEERYPKDDAKRSDGVQLIQD